MVSGTNLGYLGSLIGPYFLKKKKTYIVAKSAIQLDTRAAYFL